MNTLTVLAPSGAPASGTIVQQLDPPGNTSGASYVGFFGAGGPEGIPFAVIVAKYQDKTFITNPSGTNLGKSPFGLLGSGQLDNHKFTDTSLVNVNGQGSVALSDVPQSSGTILLRFVPSGATPVRTQNALIRTVPLNVSSGVDTVDGIVTSLKVQGYEPGADNTWTQTAGVGALDNRLFLLDHDVASLQHDFFASLSASPEAVGERNDFGFFVIIEFL
jgi:hypothetical protein